MLDMVTDTFEAVQRLQPVLFQEEARAYRRIEVQWHSFRTAAGDLAFEAAALLSKIWDDPDHHRGLRFR